MAHVQEVVRVHLFTSTEEADQAEVMLAESGMRGRRLPAHGSVPLAEVLFAASASLTALTHLISVLRRQLKRGVLVDALGADGVVVKADGSLPRGMVVIRNPNGEVEVRDAEGIGQALLGAVGTVSGREQEQQPTVPPAPGGSGA